jgi:hypothetical protein
MHWTVVPYLLIVFLSGTLLWQSAAHRGHLRTLRDLTSQAQEAALFAQDLTKQAQGAASRALAETKSCHLRLLGGVWELPHEQTLFLYQASDAETECVRWDMNAQRLVLVNLACLEPPRPPSP